MKLWGFQQEDVDKLKGLPGALIGSEMGSGKTHVGIALDVLNNPQGLLPTLVVAPLAVHQSWADKYHEQHPDTDVVVIDRKKRDAFVQAVMKCKGDVFICHYEALRLMPELAKRHYQVIIADECHRISNRKARQTRALKALKAMHKVGLSGTASGNNPENLWSILNWLYPQKYTSYWKFRRKYLLESTKTYGRGENSSQYTHIDGPNPETIGELHEEMEAFYVRHLKREQCCEHHPNGVMADLPDKVYDTIEVELNPTQRRVYQQMDKEMVAWIDQREKEGIAMPLVAGVVIAQLQRLNQIAIATPIFREKWVWKDRPNPDTHEMERVQVQETEVELTMPSSKIEALMEIVSDNPDKALLVFTASRKAADLATEQLNKKFGANTARAFTGQTPAAERRDMIQAYQDGDFRIFVGTVGSMGEGVDGLQHRTDTAIFLDRAWSAIRNKQAEDRLHRGGQKNTVQIIDIVAKNTHDAGRHQKLDLRWDSIRTMLGDKR